uniref:RNA-directed RNA polymerase n=1 Tax=Ascaris lumbricoides TaxID=6252 RepID=A0A0M3IXJ3_ASCLU
MSDDPTALEQMQVMHAEVSYKPRGFFGDCIAALIASKRNIPPDAKSRFGRKFQTKFCELAMSDDPTALEQMQVMHAEVSYKPR